MRFFQNRRRKTRFLTFQISKAKWQNIWHGKRTNMVWLKLIIVSLILNLLNIPKEGGGSKESRADLYKLPLAGLAWPASYHSSLRPATRRMSAESRPIRYRSTGSRPTPPGSCSTWISAHSVLIRAKKWERQLCSARKATGLTKKAIAFFKLTFFKFAFLTTKVQYLLEVWERASARERILWGNVFFVGDPKNPIFVGSRRNFFWP
jgi:hypothetical protein